MSKKEHIMDTAEALFNEHGYTAVGVDLIRDTAQVSKTSLYRHFSSKAKLIEEVLIRRHQRFETSVDKALQGQITTETQLDSLLDWHFNWFDQPHFKGCMFMHALAEFKESEENISELSRQHKIWLKNVVTDALKKNDKLTSSCINKRSESIMTLIEGMIVRSEFEDTTAYRKNYRELVHHISSSI
ncbi:TetR/AcrR family transcriptional regulator [Vibrio sp. HN007]|uniref:TetR/AcrR family transcriptional regulator n=1 Tax=Vibrio iocasae TaxID=3098914 RepID=UPI0035D4782E